MKTFNKEQSIFTGLISIGIGVMASSFIFFVAYFIRVRHLRFPKALMEAVSNYKFSAWLESLTSSSVNADIKLLAFMSLGAGAVIAVLIPVLLLLKLNAARKNKLYGDARFATAADIRKSASVTLGDDGGKGIVVGMFNNKLLRYIQPDFVSLSAGTRAGKGAAIVIPNLLEWIGSLLVLDLKQECYNITSLFRQKVMGNLIYLVNPFDDKTHGFNALHYVDLSKPDGATDLMGIAEIFYPTDTTTGAEKHFNESAQSILIALTEALYIFRHKELRLERTLLEHNIPNIFSIGTAVDLFHRMETENIHQLLGGLLSSEDTQIKRALGDTVLRGVVMDALDKFAVFIRLGDEAKGSVIGTFEKQMKLFSLPQFRRATDRNDFDFRDMRRTKMTIYLGILPGQVKIAGTFLNLFFTTAIKMQLAENPDFNPELKHNILMLADEFPAFGRVNYVKDSAGYIAGYKLQLLTISQSISQHQENYGDKGAETLMYNHSCKIVYSASDIKNANWYADEIGFITDKSQSDSRSRSSNKVNRGASQSDAKRHLILPQDIKMLPDNEEIILLKGEPSVHCKKAYYFNSRYFMDKLISLSPTLWDVQDKIGKDKFPSKEDLASALTRQELEAVIDWKSMNAANPFLKTDAA